MIRGHAGSTLRRDMTLDEPGDLPVICLLALREALHDADAIASARAAALVDPEGESLASCLAEIARRTATVRVAAE